MGPRLSGTSTPPAPRLRQPAAGVGSTRLQRASASPEHEPGPLPGELDRDIRSRRPAVLSFLLRLSTARRVGRVVSLVALDFAGVAFAIFTALVLKEAVHGRVAAAHDVHGDEAVPALRLPVDGAAVRQLGPLRRALAAARPAADRRFPVRGGPRRADLRRRQRRTLLQLLPLLRLAGLRAPLHLLVASAVRPCHRDAAAGCRLPAPSRPRGTGPADRRRRACAGRRPAFGDRSRRLPLADAAAGERAALARHAGRSRRGPRRGTRSTRSSSPTRTSPRTPRSSSSTSAIAAGSGVRLAPSTMEILIHRAEFIPGQSVPLFELGPPAFEGIDFALKRTFDVIGATRPAGAPEPAAARADAGRPGLLARADPVSLGPPWDRPATLPLPEVPHDAHRCRGAPGRPRRPERGLRGAVQDPRRSAPDARRAFPAPLLPGRAAAADQRAAGRDVARRATPAARARLRDARGVAPQALPGPARHHRAVAGLRPLGAGLRRSRPPRLSLPRALVAGARPDDPAEDDPRRDPAARLWPY